MKKHGIQNRSLAGERLGACFKFQTWRACGLEAAALASVAGVEQVSDLPLGGECNRKLLLLLVCQLPEGGNVPRSRTWRREILLTVADIALGACVFL